LTREGGHSHRRVVHALGDATGKEVMRAVMGRARSAPNIAILENTFTLDLLTADDRCHGALAWSASHGKMCIWAKQTILAAGGAGQLYRETTNPDIATADGHAMAYRAGAELRDMEFMQFHPTVLYIAGSARSLITEAVRGEGAYLRDRLGNRFMAEYHERAELAPRDVVSRAIAEQMARTKHPNVYLDLTHLGPEQVRRRFPMIARVCSEFGLDITRDLIPVRPGAHYMIGGVTVDHDGRTTLGGLWAAGEVTSTGLHGANRLGSNSLLEGLVFGASAGRLASDESAGMPDRLSALPLESDFAIHQDDSLDLDDIRNSLGSLLGRNAGIVRERTGLEEAAQAIAFWCRYVLAREFHEPKAWELQNLLTTARLLVAGAREREESRGVHFRSDFPETDDTHWRRHITARRSPQGNEPIGHAAAS
jgi:L-aspartate oxidase